MKLSLNKALGKFVKPKSLVIFRLCDSEYLSFFYYIFIIIIYSACHKNLYENRKKCTKIDSEEFSVKFDICQQCLETNQRANAHWEARAELSPEDVTSTEEEELARERVLWKIFKPKYALMFSFCEGKLIYRLIFVSN